jgi:hypothetical protein
MMYCPKVRTVRSDPTTLWHSPPSRQPAPAIRRAPVAIFYMVAYVLRCPRQHKAGENDLEVHRTSCDCTCKPGLCRGSGAWDMHKSAIEGGTFDKPKHFGQVHVRPVMQCHILAFVAGLCQVGTERCCFHSSSALFFFIGPVFTPPPPPARFRWHLSA